MPLKSISPWKTQNSQLLLNRQEKPLRVFLLGPCHHVYIRGCGLSKLKTYATPIGDIELDLESKQIENIFFYKSRVSY